MPAINFPAAPSLNQTFTAGAITYTWDGEKWLAGVAAGAAGATGATGLTGTAGAQGATGATGLTGGATYSVTNSGASAYTINGNTNPTISLLRGFTYYFAVAASGHPFWIKTAAVTGTGSAYTSGVTNNGVDSGTVTFQVPFDAPATLYYICQFHSSMVGTLAVTDTGPAGATGATGATGVGATGATGPQGNIGLTGATGIQGNVGLTGATGIQGNIGATGPAGNSANIAVYDETTLVTNAVTGLKFVGAGIAANLVAGNVEVTVTATGTGGSGGGFAYSNTAPATANVGDRWINSETLTSFTYINDGDSSQWIETVTRSSGALNRDLSNLSNIVAINANLTPNADSTINLGAPDRRFKDLYLSGNTLYLGSATLSATGSAINLPAGTTVGGQNVASSGDVSTGGGPKITNLQVSTAAWVVLDDTAVDITGGYIIITGTNFVSGALVYFNQTPANSVAFVSATTLRVTVPALTAGTYIVYVINSDGGTAIRVPGLTASASPAWQTASALTEQYDGAAISLGLVATDATVYTLTSGSLPPGLSLNSNTGVITGTVTGVSVDTTYTFTVTATDAQLQDSPRTFTVTITVSDPYFKLTTLLLSGSSVSANTVVRDSSTNNFNLTVSGDARASNFTPYGTGWSAYLSGSTTSGLTIADTGSLLGSGLSYTFEGWFRFFATSVTDNHWIWLAGSYPNRWTIDINVQATTIQGRIVTENNAVLWSGSSVAYTFGSWVHISAVNNAAANTFTFYFNGINAGSTTAVSLLSYASHRIGIQATNVVHASSIRLVSGQALYTGNYTPGTATLTTSSVGTTGANVAASITGTVGYLLCHTNRFLDATGKSITISGTPQISSSNPFNITNTGVNGSAYFDGTGDYIDIASNAYWNFGDGTDFTIELWAYTNNLATQHNLWSNTGTNSSGYNSAYINTNGTIGIGKAGVNEIISATSTWVSAQWNHLAFVRNGSNLTIFFNGVSVASTASASTYLNNATAGLSIGRNYQTSVAYFTGYISNYRVVKGTAVYTANFTPLTSPLTAIANTQLLTLQYDQPHNNHTFLDSSSNQFLITRNGNATQGTFSPFSQTGWGNYFDGGDKYLSFAGANTANAMGTGDWTFEAWLYPTTSGTDRSIFDTEGQGTITTALRVRLGTSNQLILFVGGVVASGGNVPANTWTHVAICKSSGSTRLFVNGSQVGSTYSDSNNYTCGVNRPIICVDGYASSTLNFYGFISNLRVVKGQGLFTGTFTPSNLSLGLTTVGSTGPGVPTQNITGTVSLLTCQSNRFIDNSTNNFTITRNGDPSVQAFSPFATTAVYNPAIHGGSAYFDGTGDGLTTPNVTALNLYNTTNTVECWVYLTSHNGANGTIIYGTDFDGTYYTTWSISSSGVPGYGSRNGTSINASTAIKLNEWTYIVWGRSGNSVSIWINGIRSINQAITTEDQWGTASIIIGRFYGSDRFSGYLSGLRVIKGTDVYGINNTTITIPTAPVTATTNTSLLLNFTDAAILDSTGRNSIETAADVKSSSVVTKFTGGSMYFDGTGDWAITPTSPINDLSIGNWTIEFWIYPTTAASQQTIINFCTSASNYNGTNIWMNTSRQLVVDNTQVNQSAFSGGTLTLNTWNHVAITRISTTTTGYINGSSVGTNSYTPNSNQAVCLGYLITIGYPFNGYLSDIRITKGYARYTANFTAPTAPARLK